MLTRRLPISLFLGLLVLGSLGARDYGFFTPPHNWELVDPKKLSPGVKIGFIGPTKKELRPSINLAIEEVNVSLSDYVLAVKKIHEADPNNRWRDLGKFWTHSRESRLTEIESRSEYGQIRLMQLITLKNKTAYIITASALKEEFSNFYQDFQSVFRFFNVTADLIGALPDPTKRYNLQSQIDSLGAVLNEARPSNASLEKAFSQEEFQKKSYPPFQNSIIHDYSAMGAYWQVLVLQFTHENLIKES